MQRRSYPSDLSEREWAILEPLIPPAKPGGHPRTTDMREVINAILYLDRTGCQWRALPHEFPPWSTVWSYFRTWRNNGTWKRMHTALREGMRVKGRKRHVLVDTMGLIAGVLVHEANIQDHDGGKELLWPLKGCLPRLQLIWAVSRLQEGRLRRVGQRGTRLGSGDRGASLEWHARGLGTQGCRDRLGADPPKRLPCPQMALDRGAHVCLAFHLAQASL